MSERRRVPIGLLTAPGLAHELVKELAERLSQDLAERVPDVECEIEIKEEPRIGAAAGADVDLVEVARKHLLNEDWELVVGLTDLPLHVGHNPVTAHASVSLGVGLISVPALGAMGLEERLHSALLRMIAGLVQDRHAERPRSLKELAPAGRPQIKSEGSVRFVAGAVRGNLHLLLGMVRANRPWRFVAGMSRALVGALGTTAASLASTGIWHLADGMTWLRLTLLSLGSVVTTVVSLIGIHRLWEHAPGGRHRDRVVLMNLATTITIVLGVLTLYLALLIITTTVGAILIPSSVFADQVSHPAGVDEYVRLAFLVSAVATIGGALGGAVENRQTVREAAYGYRPDTEADADSDDTTEEIASSGRAAA